MSEIRVDSITDEVGTSSPDFPNGILKSSLPAGSVIQVVSATKTDTQSIAGVARNDFKDVTGLSVSITPSSVDSKILVLGHINGVVEDFGAITRIVRNTTSIGIADTAGSRTLGHSSTNFGVTGNDLSTASMPIHFLDSPSSTSTLTYKVQLGQYNTGSGTLYINRQQDDQNSTARGRMISAITLMEIAG